MLADGDAHRSLALLVGVMSWPSPTARTRREAMRRLHAPLAVADVRLRFVLGASDADAAHGDVLVFNISRNDRGFGTFLLTCRFFQYALNLPDVKFIARADDDSAFNATSVAATLLRLAPLHRHMIYGPFGEWAMLRLESMLPTCWANSVRRWQKAMELRDSGATAAAAGDGSNHGGTGSVHVCGGNGTSVAGPFPFAKGPFVAYSRSVVAAFAHRLDSDAAQALAHAANTRHRWIVYDDIYAGFLTYHALGSEPVTLINAPLSEYVHTRERALRPAAILHQLKSPKRWDYVLQRQKRLFTPSWKEELRCGGVQFAAALPAQHVARLRVTHCCRQWRFCDWKGWHRVEERKIATLQSSMD